MLVVLYGLCVAFTVRVYCVCLLRVAFIVRFLSDFYRVCCVRGVFMVVEGKG